jgi:hypothetical protein
MSATNISLAIPKVGQIVQGSTVDFFLNFCKVAPLKGITLHGIIEFSDKNTIRLDFEPTQENRPKEFVPK